MLRGDALLAVKVIDDWILTEKRNQCIDNVFRNAVYIFESLKPDITFLLTWIFFNHSMVR